MDKNQDCGKWRDEIGKLKKRHMRYMAEFSKCLKTSDFDDLEIKKDMLKLALKKLRVKIPRQEIKAAIKEFKFEQKYKECLEKGQGLGLFEKGGAVIRGIDGKLYPAPTWEEIRNKITLKQVRAIKKHLRYPRFLLVPIGMPIQTIIEKIEAKEVKNPNKPKPENITVKWDFDDVEMVYFPDKFDKDNHGGLTKEQLLGTDNKFNSFPGWQVLVVDGHPAVDEETVGITAEDTQREMQNNGLSGLTHEEWLILNAYGLPVQTFDWFANWTYLLGSYFPNEKMITIAKTSADDPEWSLEFESTNADLEETGNRPAVRIL